MNVDNDDGEGWAEKRGLRGSYLGIVHQNLVFRTCDGNIASYYGAQYLVKQLTRRSVLHTCCYAAILVLIYRVCGSGVEVSGASMQRISDCIRKCKMSSTYGCLAHAKNTFYKRNI